ncbi:MAG: hypothetical protein CO150_00250 [Nitrospirae bacterium CG_4_9_14_3_um_filter_53_35]|nr:MAG: hypothetical protein COZ95_02340 [Nitrospirae bacterium CG_4_8_14_3_um_filter_50_41]PIX86911.1 MAG: hypothetical protein COZ32_00925 [Nitrospirae bacterium CG_4_10_14_3_um_filter_53_41]PJA77569.1 MAG: hypothetical protein CO150_00250 [Nitrospirae bacterium CG_4_9_14_3_um_filter_53_35]
MGGSPSSEGPIFMIMGIGKRGSFVEVLMKVHIDEIPAEGLVVDLAEDGGRLFKDETEIRFKEKILSRLVLNRLDLNITVSGNIRFRIFLQCSRCLKDFPLTVDKDFDLEYRPVSEISKGGESQLSADELDILYYHNGAIDLDETLMGQVAEAIPLKPLCSEMCRGLCPHCGKNLNEGECSYATGPLDPRLVRLKDLLNKKDIPST